MKMWGGRFDADSDRDVERYCNSIRFDQILFREDIIGSIAHAMMLSRQGIIDPSEGKTIVAGLKKVGQRIETDSTILRDEDEDIHMNVERLLTEEIGPVGGKLHTARSRNDQVALDMRLYTRARSFEIVALAHKVQVAIIEQANKNRDVILPGYTHLQRAQPVLFSHHLMVYWSMLQRDIERFIDSWPRINIMPLGAGALAGTTFPIDRNFVAELLQFDSLYLNSIDAVSDRDFLIELLSNSALLITHLSRLSEEIVLWMSSEFRFIDLDDALCTGSSIMPQKKNPDVAELVRGKSGRVYGNLIGLLTVLKGLPLSYNKDLQEDKEGVFDTVETVQGALALYQKLIRGMRVDAKNMREAVSSDYSNATDLADYLAKKGVPFRDAHAITGKIVRYCIEKEKWLLELSLAEFQEFSPLIDQTIFECLKPEAVVAARKSIGGTAPEQVARQIEVAKSEMQATESWLASVAKKLEPKPELRW